MYKELQLYATNYKWKTSGSRKKKIRRLWVLVF